MKYTIEELRKLREIFSSNFYDEWVVKIESSPKKMFDNQSIMFLEFLERIEKEALTKQRGASMRSCDE